MCKTAYEDYTIAMKEEQLKHCVMCDINPVKKRNSLCGNEYSLISL